MTPEQRERLRQQQDEIDRIFHPGRVYPWERRPLWQGLLAIAPFATIVVAIAVGLARRIMGW